MESLKAYRKHYGEFFYPEWDEVAAAVLLFNGEIEPILLSCANLKGVKGVMVSAARRDLAGNALSRGEGFTRIVRSFNDLTRAELIYVRDWFNVAKGDTRGELAALGWLPPSKYRLERLLKEDDLSSVAIKTIKERWLA
jgi:hypothetical protein